MNELQYLICEGKKAIIRLVNCLESYDLPIEGTVDFGGIQETFAYLKGYADCLDKYRLFSKAQKVGGGRQEKLGGVSSTGS
jgi:hypothetical protein